MLELRDVAYRHPGSTRPALEGIGLAIRDGEAIGVVGANESGKSTLCLVASGLAPSVVGGHLAGELRIDGRSTAGLAAHELVSRVGFVFDDPAAQRSGVVGTVFEEVAFGPVNLGLPVDETVARTDAALTALGIERLALRDPSTLSGGESQLVAIASVLAMRPGHLVLDEPTAELDPDGTRLVGESLRSLRGSGVSLLVAEHRTELLATLCDRVVALDGGRIALDGPAPEVLGDRRLRGLGVRSPADAAAPRHRGPSTPGAPGAPVAVRCSGLVHEFADGTRALDGIDLEIRAGERVAIVGPNGAGKSTLALHLDGLLRPTAGAVEVGGVPAAERRVAELARLVGIVFQDPDRQIFARRLRDEVAFGPRALGVRGVELDRAVEEALAAVGLEGSADRHPYDLGRAGRRLLAIASVLAMRTPVVVLDEPTTGQDARGIEMIGRIVSALVAQGRTVVAISHDRRFVAEHLDRAIELRAGRIVADGAVGDVLARDPART